MGALATSSLPVSRGRMSDPRGAYARKADKTQIVRQPLPLEALPCCDLHLLGIPEAVPHTQQVGCLSIMEALSNPVGV